MELLFFLGIALLFFFLMSGSDSYGYHNPGRHRSSMVVMNNDPYYGDRFDQWHYMHRQQSSNRIMIVCLVVAVLMLLRANGCSQDNIRTEDVAKKERPARGRY